MCTKFYKNIMSQFWTKAKKDFSHRDPCKNAIIKKEFSCQNQYNDIPIFVLKYAKNDITNNPAKFYSDTMSRF